jgi:hypothetical protein
MYGRPDLNTQNFAQKASRCNRKNNIRLFSSSGCEVRPTNKLFRPHDYIRPVVYVEVFQIFFRYFDTEELVLGVSCLPSS